MLVKFFKRGLGNNATGASVRNYLLGPDFNFENGKIRAGATLLRGNPEHTTKLIDQSPYQKKYLSGCLSFHSEESMTEPMKQYLMDEFEKCLLPGLDANQYSVYWVEHTDKQFNAKPRLELNFVFSSTELSTGRFLNCYYHFADVRRVDLWQTIINHQLNLSDPKRPDRQQALTQNPHDRLPLLQKDKKQHIHQQVEMAIKTGMVTNRVTLLKYLADQGYSINRAGKDSISIYNETGKNLKFKGSYYHADFQVDATFLSSMEQKVQAYEQKIAQAMPQMLQTYAGLLAKRQQELNKRFKSQKEPDFDHGLIDGIDLINPSFTANRAPPTTATATYNATYHANALTHPIVKASQTFFPNIAKYPESTKPKNASLGITAYANLNAALPMTAAVRTINTHKKQYRLAKHPFKQQPIMAGHFSPSFQPHLVNAEAVFDENQHPYHKFHALRTRYHYPLAIYGLVTTEQDKYLGNVFSPGYLKEFNGRKEQRLNFSLAKDKKHLIKTQPSLAWQSLVIPIGPNSEYQYRHTQFGFSLGFFSFRRERISIRVTTPVEMEHGRLLKEYHHQAAKWFNETTPAYQQHWRNTQVWDYNDAIWYFENRRKQALWPSIESHRKQHPQLKDKLQAMEVVAQEHAQAIRIKRQARHRPTQSIVLATNPPKDSNRPTVSGTPHDLSSLRPTQKYQPANPAPTARIISNWFGNAVNTAGQKRQNHFTDARRSIKHITRVLDELSPAVAGFGEQLTQPIATTADRAFNGFTSQFTKGVTEGFTTGLASDINLSVQRIRRRIDPWATDRAYRRAAENHQRLNQSLSTATAGSEEITGYYRRANHNHQQLKLDCQRLNHATEQLSSTSQHIASTSHAINCFLALKQQLAAAKMNAKQVEKHQRVEQQQALQMDKPTQQSTPSHVASVIPSVKSEPNQSSTPKQPTEAEKMDLSWKWKQYEYSHPHVSMTTYATASTYLGLRVDIRALGLAAHKEDSETAQISSLFFKTWHAIPAHYQPLSEALAWRLYNKSWSEERATTAGEAANSHNPLTVYTPMAFLAKTYQSLGVLTNFIKQNTADINIMRDYDKMPIEIFADVYKISLEPGLVEQLVKMDVDTKENLCQQFAKGLHHIYVNEQQQAQAHALQQQLQAAQARKEEQRVREREKGVNRPADDSPSP